MLTTLTILLQLLLLPSRSQAADCQPPPLALSANDSKFDANLGSVTFDVSSIKNLELPIVVKNGTVRMQLSGSNLTVTIGGEKYTANLLQWRGVVHSLQEQKVKLEAQLMLDKKSSAKGDVALAWMYVESEEGTQSLETVAKSLKNSTGAQKYSLQHLLPNATSRFFRFNDSCATKWNVIADPLPATRAILSAFSQVLNLTNETNRAANAKAPEALFRSFSTNTDVPKKQHHKQQQQQQQQEEDANPNSAFGTRPWLLMVLTVGTAAAAIAAGYGVRIA